MKHIAFVMDDFYPNPSPNGNCAKKIIDVMREKYQISVICLGDSSKPRLRMENVEVYSISNWRYRLRNILQKKESLTKNKALKMLYRSSVLVLRIIRALIATYAWPSSEKWFINKTFKQLNQLHKKKRIDALITISYPFESHISGLKFKRLNKDVKWITYSLDPFSCSKTIHKFIIDKKAREKRNIQSECEVYSTADNNFILVCMARWFESVTRSCSAKYEILALPLFEKYPLIKSESGTSQKIHLLFAGSLIQNIRNPQYLLDLFMRTENENMILHLYSKGNCGGLIQKYIAMSNGRIIEHGIVSIDEIHKAMLEADILINIGNSIAEQMPSKLFEYISTGKPIINIYHDNYSYSEILSQYPICLNIKEDYNEIDKNRKLFQEFCEINQQKRVGFEAIEDLYKDNMPKNVAAKFDQCING